MESPSILYPKNVDLTNCDKEPIHILGKIQDHGFLLAFDKENGKITYFSENTLSLFKKDRSQILSLSLKDVFPEFIIKELSSTLLEKGIHHIHKLINGIDYILIIHENDDTIIIEIEPEGEKPDAFLYQERLSKIITKLNHATDAQMMCDTVAELIKEYFGYDRVMIYQFDTDWNGKIVSEKHNPELESWLGLHYPASDIPQQARKLFLKQGARIISDVSANSIDVLTSPANSKPLDLSRSELRAVSPIHIEYLSNMKVGATLTAAIIYQNKLWGLIACHHYSPKFLSYHHRISCKFITQVFSAQLGLLSANSLLKKTNESNKVRSKLIEKMSENWDIESIISDKEYSILNLTEADGAAICLNQEITTIGKTPNKEEIKILIEWISKNLDSDIYTSNHLNAALEVNKETKQTASGIMAVFISKVKRDVILWFKPEIRQTVDWAGNPDKSVVKEGAKLSPRKSFEKWSEIKAGYSNPWLDYEIAAAKALKEHISEIIVEKYDEIKSLNKKLQNAYKELEFFSYSVSHDLRAPLRGIDGFAQIIKEDYFDSLDEYGQQAVGTIISSINKMNLLIDDILSFSGLGKVPIKHKEISMREIVEDSLAFLQAETLFHNVTIEILELPKTYGDEKMIFQLFNNLIGNALKYSSKTTNPRVEIGYREGAYFVKDNGIGFDEQHNKKIFDVFSRLVNDDYEGSGIGLAIAKRVVEKHHGKIWTESKLNDGATFYFTLREEEII